MLKKLRKAKSSPTSLNRLNWPGNLFKDLDKIIFFLIKYNIPTIPVCSPFPLIPKIDNY
jgi:hypothetical protein